MSVTAHTLRSVEPNCQSIAGPPIDEAIGALVAERMTPAAVELALEIRREIEARHEEADQLRCRAIERAQIEADLAQRRFMLVDPSNRLVADTLEAEWNDKLRALAQAREERERGRQQDQLVLDDAIRQRLVAMTTDFKKLWNDPSTPNRERKRLLAYIIEDATLIKLPMEGITKIHVRFKGGKTETLTTLNPKVIGAAGQDAARRSSNSSTSSSTITSTPKSPTSSISKDFVPADRPDRGAAALVSPRCASPISSIDTRFALATTRLRDRGMLTKAEAAARLGIHEATLIRWAEHGIITRHAYNAHAYLYEMPDSNQPAKHCSRWDRLVDRAAALKIAKESKPSDPIEGGVV